MVAGPVYVQPITEGMVYAWYCETCRTQGRTERVLRNPMDQTTRFEIRCPDDTLTHVDVTDELLVTKTRQTRRFRHQRREPSVQNGDMQIRCLSGCGEVINSVVLTDHARDGRLITPGCHGPRFTIFVSEQLWRSGISRISYRHDGNYVVFDRDMKLVAEGREASPEWPQEGFEPELESEYARRMASAMNEQINQEYAHLVHSDRTVHGTWTVTGTFSGTSETLSDYQRHVQLIREMANERDAAIQQREAERQREQEDYRSRTISPEEYERRQRRRNQRAPAPMTEADLEREQIWREYQMGIAARPQEELTLTYNDLLRAMNSVEALASPPKPAKPLEPRRRRAVIRRALEKK